jgi:hypothetical protein
MDKMKRKSQEYMMSSFIKIVLLIVFLVFGFMLLGKLFMKEKQSIDAVCKMSIIENSKLRDPGTRVETVKVNCPTKYVTFGIEGYNEEFEKTNNQNELGISNRKETIYYKKESKKCSSLLANDQEACIFLNVNQVMANEMKRCWFNFGNGELRIFSLYKEDKKTQCMVCTTFFFDEEMATKYESLGYLGQYKPEDKSYNLDYYMRTTKADPWPTTIYNFTQDILDKNWETPVYDYGVKKEYSIVISAMNENYVKTIAKGIADKIFSTSTSTDEGNFINVMHFIPNEEVPAYCSTWA